MENPHGNHSDVNESLMQAIVITRPLYSYVLVAFIIASLITIIWSIFGSIPQRIEGIGEIDTKRGLERINGAYGGEISEIRIKLNDSVKNGDVLFVIMRPEMKSRIQKMKISIEQLKQKKALIYSGNNKNTVIKKKVDKLGESRLKQKIKEINKNLLFFEKVCTFWLVIYIRDEVCLCTVCLCTVRNKANSFVLLIIKNGISF